MTEINMKIAIVLIMVLSSVELMLLESTFFSRALLNYYFPKDLEIVRVRTSEEAKAEKGVRVLDFIGLVTRHGYPAEEHSITTEDGYNLKIHRIPDSPLSNSKENKKLLFFQHGIIASSDSWVLSGPGKDLAFLLADQGYDVWFGNVRGNTYSRSHVKMSPRDGDFWQFSYHEVATIDVPNMIDYVLNYTGKKNLYYMGHSMGTSLLFVLLSTRSEYNAKIKLGVCLSPIAFWNEVSPVIRQAFNFWPKLMEFFNNNEVYEVTPLSPMAVTNRKLLCADGSKFQAFCIALLFVFAGSDPAQINTTKLPEIFSHYPAGSSVLTVDHFYQNIVTNDFRQYYNHGLNNYDVNVIKTVKRYELEKITTPLVLIYGANDMIGLRSNVLELCKRLPNVILLEEIPYKFFNHLDFIWAIDAKSILYDRLIDILQEFEAKQPSENLFWTT